MRSSAASASRSRACSGGSGRAEARLGDGEAAASSPSRFDAGTRTSSRASRSARPLVVAEDLEGAHPRAHGVSIGRGSSTGAGTGGASGFVTPITWRADNAGRPRRGPPLVRVDHVLVAVALDAARDVHGVGARDPRLGHREARPDLAVEVRLQPALLLSGVPNWARISMLPVSGAAQLVASGSSGEEPITAPAVRSRCSTGRGRARVGQKRFHRPRERASALWSSMTAGGVCGSPDSSRWRR